jgi:hypothetical protein
MAAYREGVYLGVSERHTATEVADDYYTTVNSNIKMFLRDKCNKLTVQLERLGDEFPTFWKAIAAKGDIKKAIAELKSNHNAS